MGLRVPAGLQEDHCAAGSYWLGGRLAWVLWRDEISLDLLVRAKARTLLVAAVLDDGVDGAKVMGRELGKTNDESRVVKLDGKRHVRMGSCLQGVWRLGLWRAECLRNLRFCRFSMVLYRPLCSLVRPIPLVFIRVNYNLPNPLNPTARGIEKL
jgi:hypothetical protein